MKRSLNPDSMSKRGPVLDQKAIVHATHMKAGSQWVRSVLSDLFPHRIIEPDRPSPTPEDLQIVPGKVYPCFYKTYTEFKSTAGSEQAAPFFVLRDLRDTLISLYFSIKGSHPLSNPVLLRHRTILNKVDLDSGLVFLMFHGLDYQAEVQESWLGSGCPVFRFEDMILDPLSEFDKILRSLGVSTVDHARLKVSIEANSFERFSGGRARGVENSESHYRKGVSGDWRNYFSDHTVHLFKSLFGRLIVKAGYETSDEW